MLSLKTDIVAAKLTKMFEQRKMNAHYTEKSAKVSLS